MKLTSSSVALVLAAACSGSGGQPQAQPPAPALSWTDLAGTWSMQAWRDSSSVLLSTYRLTGGAEPRGWTISFPNRVAVPLRVRIDGDSLIAEAGPYESVVRAGIAVVTRAVLRLREGRLAGSFMSRYASNMVDSVLTGRTEGERAP